MALRAVVAVLPTVPLPSGVADPVLQGQSQANADNFGIMTVEDLVLMAAPHTYNLSVSLPDWPEVSLLCAKQISCQLAKWGEKLH